MEQKNLNKFKRKDLYTLLASKTGLSNIAAKKIIDDLINILKNQIKKGNINLKNFGTFKILNKKERIGINPKNKIKYVVTARKSVSFIPSDVLKKKLNN
tara:strand:+ start:396 stop:692 length:297 start_codon:yes stop_codon:yes gene_type:complete